MCSASCAKSDIAPDERRDVTRAFSEILFRLRFNHTTALDRALKLPHDYQYPDAKPKADRRAHDPRLLLQGRQDRQGRPVARRGLLAVDDQPRTTRASPSWSPTDSGRSSSAWA